MMMPTRYKSISGILFFYRATFYPAVIAGVSPSPTLPEGVNAIEPFNQVRRNVKTIVIERRGLHDVAEPFPKSSELGLVQTFLLDFQDYFAPSLDHVEVVGEVNELKLLRILRTEGTAPEPAEGARSPQAVLLNLLPVLFSCSVI